MHDTPAELAQPLFDVKDWKKGECEADSWQVTMPAMKVVERDYPNTYKQASPRSGR
jgi:nitrate reductase / nitrite oxidoreductase, alpha subunit